MERTYCNLCRSEQSEVVSVLRKRPENETDYHIPADQYFREIRRCLNCSVYFNHYDFNLLSDDFYAGFYNASIETGKLADRFDRIINLPPESSDNKQRAARVLKYMNERYQKEYLSKSVLDVGTGTGVFVYEMAKAINNTYCVDPDKNSIALVKSKIKVKDAWVGTIESIPLQTFDVITYNKVLEHVLDPIALLKVTQSYLSKDGILYIELPYATNLVADNLQEVRAEFFIEHYTTYTEKSLQYLIKSSGYKMVKMDILTEPSGKHTIYAFATLL